MNPLLKIIIDKGLNEDLTELGDVTDLYDLYGTTITASHYVIASLGRGDNPMYGDVSTLEWGLHNYTNNQLLVASIGLGNNKKVKDISHLDPHMHCIDDYRRYSNFNSIAYPQIHEYMKV